jgi:glycosyltransferase involved in cell wall biosynthesis
MTMTTSSRPTRLCVVNPFGYGLFDPGARASKVFGGAEVQLYYLATALAADERFEVSMIVEQPPSGDLPDASEGIRMVGVPVMSSRVAWLRDRIPLPERSYFGAMRRADADVYLQRGGAVLTGDVALYCRLNGRRFAFMVAHDWDCDLTHRHGRQYLSGAYYLAGLHRAHRVFTQSEYQRKTLAWHHGIQSLVQPTVYPAGQVEVERDHVLWVGRCLGWKQPMAFLELAETRPETTFVMACPVYDGAQELYEQVRRRSSQLHNVRFLDFVPFAETKELFSRALAFVNTSTTEGFPNTFVQAARAGTPILSLEVNPDNILERADIGACAFGDPGRLAWQLGELLDQPTIWKRQAESASQYFQREHNLVTRIPAFAEALASIT